MITLGAGQARLDLHARQLIVDGRPAHLGARAFDLLVALVLRSDRVVTKQELLDLVWRGLVVEENNLHVQVLALRRLLGAGAIVTLPGRGYRFLLPHSASPEAIAGIAGGKAEAAGSTPNASSDDLIGRENLIAAADQLLARDGLRLLTFTGPGGAGKTRLALRVTARQAERMAAGAYVVMLAPLRDASQILTTIAASIGLQANDAGGADTLLRDFLQPRAVLLMLDNLEHLPDAARQIGALLADCPRLKVLATSRSPLHLKDEHELPVPPLALPQGNRPEQLRASPAVMLLVRRAHALGRALGDSARDWQTAAAICVRLDGLPLAIELAAARLRVLTPEVLMARLEHPLLLLTGGTADAPPRQRTLRDTIAWSHALLDPGAQCLFRRLGCFVGGWSLGGAEAMVSDPAATVDSLARLLDLCLIQRIDDVDGQPRFTMLETIREFALERLVDSGEQVLVRQRHAAYFADLAEPQDRRLRSGQRAPALELLRAERNNLRTALHTALHGDTPDAPLAGRLAAALAWWWYFDDAAGEGQAWCQACLAMPLVMPLKARVLLAAARAAVHGGQTAVGLAWAEQAATLAAQTSDADTQAQALLLQAIPVVTRSRDRAVALMERCIQLVDSLGNNPWDLALAHALMGMVLAWHPGSEDRAEAFLADARDQFLALEDDWCLATTTRHLARIAARRGRIAQSRQFALQTLMAAERSGFAFLAAGARHHLAQLALAEGDVPAALQAASASILTSWQQGHRRDVLLSCRWIAALKWRQGEVPDAIALFAVGSGEIDEQLSMAATIMTPADQQAWTTALDELRAQVPAEQLARHWRVGALAPLEQVLARLGLLPRPGDDATAPPA